MEGENIKRSFLTNSSKTCDNRKNKIRKLKKNKESRQMKEEVTGVLTSLELRNLR